ncbi:hypothetical protein LR48_Vigan02g110800 [Vigna angularis]|uniref:Uncharacterized protein n=1 Tax=Phaseolus angularis TaxID=3914 RepID=A0A0L9TWL9_PHAAN|nr:hypothetical protein LR48_Vigan02g110800 [Vigna angularis]
MSSSVASEFSRRKGVGYADGAAASSSSTNFDSGNERNPPANHQVETPAFENSSRLLEDSGKEEVGINVDYAGAWDGRSEALPDVVGYDWAPHRVKLYASSVITKRTLKELVNRLSFVKAAGDADFFKLALCQLNERACHGQEGYASNFFYAYSYLFRDLRFLRFKSTSAILEDAIKKIRQE